MLRTTFVAGCELPNVTPDWIVSLGPGRHAAENPPSIDAPTPVVSATDRFGESVHLSLDLIASASW